jgi:hypothetical protein
MTWIVVVVVILIVFQTTNNLIQLNKLSKITENNMAEISHNTNNQLSGAVVGAGVMRMCINTPPSITYECNLTNAILNTSQHYECRFIATDPNGDSITFSSKWVDNYSVQNNYSLFNITSSGYINFTPKKTAMGHVNTVNITVRDNSICSNNARVLQLNMTVTGVNRPPYLIKNIPDQKLIKDHNFIFYLSDYFADPDEDILTYDRQTMYGYTVSIPQVISGNQVIVRGLSCGNTTLYYRAKDSEYTTWSNTVTYEVLCPNDYTPSYSQSSDGSGGGGGGGSSDVCTPNWKCSDWSACTYGNFTYRRCIDFAGCDSKNYQHYMFENCTYAGEKDCTEAWECNPWSTCVNNIHTRNCMDLKNCGTNKTKPNESESCDTIMSCFNGIKDEGETAVDCGGQCGVCRNIENPMQINKPNVVIIIIGALAVGLTGTLTFTFRAKIMAAYMRAFGKKPRIKRKVYINNKQKEKLLQILNIAQARIDEHKVDYAIDELSIFIKEYFKQLLAIDNLDKKELVTQIVKLKDKDLEKILVMFYAKIINTIHLRNRGIEVRESEIQTLIDEVSHEIYLIAEFSDQDAISSIKDRSTESSETLDKAYNKMSNLYIALKFGEIFVARDIYKEIVKDYELLSNKDKTTLYADIIRAFHAINYLDKLYKTNIQI